MQTQMDNPTSDSSAPHRTEDCIRNLKFVYTTNGGYDYHQARQTAPTGDCMVIAASVATGICYAEAERRLSLLAGSVAKCGDKLGALEGTNSRDPADGTHPLTSKLFLRTHYFVKRGSCHCLCDAQAPHIVMGVTDNGESHAAAVHNGCAYGTYDITANLFEGLGVWELDWQLLEKLRPSIRGHFTNQTTLNADIRRRLCGDE